MTDSLNRRRARSWWVCLVITACAEQPPPLAPLTQRQALSAPVKLGDFATAGTNPSSSPYGFMPAFGGALFTASTPTEGIELWFSDGTAPGTHLVADINAGPTSSLGQTTMVALGPVVYFTAQRGGANELWRTDGSPIGTRRLFTGTPAADTVVAGPILHGTKLAFMVDHGLTNELFISDGVTATSLGSTGSYSPFLVSTGTALFFLNETNLGVELWASDGTLAQTHLVQDSTPGLTGSQISNLVAANSKVFYLNKIGSTGTKLWVSDGTDPGTHVLDYLPGSNSTRFSTLVPFGDKVAFLMGDPAWLMVSDGTLAGTVKVSDAVFTTPDLLFDPGLEGGTAFGGRAYLAVNHADHSTGLWTTDGTPAGTFELSVFHGASLSNPPRQFQALNGVLYFLAGSPTNAVWGLDDPAHPDAGARSLAATTGTQPNGLAAINNSLWLGATVSSANIGQEPYAISPADGGLTLIRDIAGVRSSSNFSTGSHTKLGNQVIASGYTQGNSGNLIITDGTPAGTRTLFRPPAGFGGMQPTSLTTAGPLVYFVGNTPNNNGIEVWRTDGTDAGTFPAFDLSPGAGLGSTFGELAGLADGTLLMGANGANTGLQLWVGRPDAGAQRLFDPAAGLAYAPHVSHQLRRRRLRHASRPRRLRVGTHRRHARQQLLPRPGAWRSLRRPLRADSVARATHLRRCVSHRRPPHVLRRTHRHRRTKPVDRLA